MNRYLILLWALVIISCNKSERTLPYYDTPLHTKMGAHSRFSPNQTF